MSTSFVIPRRAIVASIVLVFALGLGAFAYIRLPQATITVMPATFDRQINQEITLSTAAREPDFIRYILPAKFFEKEVTETKRFERNGAAKIDDFARGTVKMINKQPDEQRLLPQTHLRHDASGVFFLTDSPVVIPPQGEVSVNITAKEKGASGNVTAGKFIIDKLPASFQDVVYAESTTDLTGGVTVDRPLTDAELNQAKEEVSRRAREKATAELTSAAGGAGVNPDLVSIEITEETVSAQPGSKTTEFTVQYKIKARGFFPDNNDVLSLTLLSLRSSPKPDEEFVSYAPESFKLEIIRSDFTRGEARVRGSLTGSFASKTGPTLFSADNLAGRSEAEVQEYFKQFPSVGSVEVAFSPFWVQTVPSRPEATKIVIKNHE